MVSRTKLLHENGRPLVLKEGIDGNLLGKTGMQARLLQEMDHDKPTLRFFIDFKNNEMKEYAGGYSVGKDYLIRNGFRLEERQVYASDAFGTIFVSGSRYNDIFDCASMSPVQKLVEATDRARDEEIELLYALTHIRIPLEDPRPLLRRTESLTTNAFLLRGIVLVANMVAKELIF